MLKQSEEKQKILLLNEFFPPFFKKEIQIIGLISFFSI